MDRLPSFYFIVSLLNFYSNRAVKVLNLFQSDLAIAAWYWNISPLRFKFFTHAFELWYAVQLKKFNKSQYILRLVDNRNSYYY